MAGTVDVILGVDFGTRFSKICYRILDGSKPRIVSFEIAGQSVSIIESLLWVDPNRQFLTSLPTSRLDRLLPLQYLKMLLMEDPEACGQPVLDYDFMQPLSKTIPALACYLVYQLIRRSMLRIITLERRKLEGRKVNWSLNLSIPAQYANDGRVPLFSDVGSVAMLWSLDAVARHPREPRSPANKPMPGHEFKLLTPTVEAIRERYVFDRPEANEKVDVSVTPEIVSALHYFLRRPMTPEGIHGFIDIGAGTIDACIFRINHDEGEAKIPVLSAKVESLGTASIARRIAKGQAPITPEELEIALVNPGGISARVSMALSSCNEPLKNFLATLAIDARDKLMGRVLVHDPAAYALGDMAQLDQTFNFHSTGGAARSLWYRTVMEAVHSERKMKSHNIMGWRVEPAQAPTDFPSGDHDFSRFVIAWGLTAEGADLDTLKFFLPNQVGVAPTSPERRPIIPLYEGH